MIILPKNMLIKISKSMENNSVFKSRQGHPILKKAMFFSLCCSLFMFLIAHSRLDKRLPTAINSDLDKQIH